jgi:peptidylprolyl isomerase
VSSRARAAALEAERRRSMRKRLIGALVVGVLVLALLAGALLATRDSGGKAAATTTTSLETATSAPVESAAGKPCVPLADPLPAGAPDVPVEVGPPPTSLVTRDLKVGDGPEVTAGQTVKADYIGVSCSTGKIFDSSYKRGEPAEFPLANVIKGWQQGIPGMKVGGQRLLGIPPDLAYGDNPPPAIAAGETLWFVVQIVSAT